jgi:CubicO group peptidase (beta-lactamase class C family)
VPATIDPAPLDSLAADFADRHHCPSLAWGVVRDGELAATGSVGEVSEQTVFRIASMTKSFSAAATLALRDDGVLRLDDPIAGHAPELAAVRGPTADAAAPTIRDLLSMTSGLVTDDPWADRHLDLADDELNRLVARGLVWAEPTGSALVYSNLGYALLGRVVRRATGRPLQRHVSERLLGPLGLTRTSWSGPAGDDWARPFRWRDDHPEPELPPLGDGAIAPMGGLWSTVGDLARWVSFLDDAFPARDGSDDAPLRRSSRREMQTSQQWWRRHHREGATAALSYGYGLAVADDDRLGRVASHSGGLPGYGSNMRWLPGRRLGAIALANVTYAPAAVLTIDMLDHLHDAGHVEDAARAPSVELRHAADRLVALLADWSAARADDLFADNVALDEPYERRRLAAEAHAPLVVRSLTARDDASATIVATGRDGRTVHVELTLAPARPVRIQQYSITVSS